MRSQKATSLSTSFLQLAKMLWPVFNIMTISLLLSSCIFSDNKAPAFDLSRKPVAASTRPSHHKVKSGETLFAIAWRYGLDYRELARINGIGNSNLIYAGQSLILSGKSANNISRSSKSDPQSRTSSSLSTQTKKPKTASSSRSVSRVSTSQRTVATPSRPRSEKKSAPKKTVTKSKSSSAALMWRWPTKGKVITNYSAGNTKNKGIDLLGKKGDSVFAAATGTVVYAGSGLRAYGKLIIIKHNDIYLSAYAHNDRIRVKEGQKVKAGQHIANIGSSGSRTESVKLHFEIRRNGQPINPLKILPKRKT
jgi:lipoprotein NlpD